MVGLQAFIIFLVTFLIVAALTPVIRKYALRWKLGDKPNGRKLHTETIPHLGGIGIAVGVAVGLVVALLMTGDAALQSLLLKLAVPVAAIVGLGIIDDIKSLRAAQKLVVQSISALAIAMLGIVLLLGLPGFDQNIAFVVVLTTIYLVGLSSAVNLIDGHDGVAGGVCLISAAAFGVISILLGAQPLFFLCLTLMGACAGFLVYNFPPGRIFMGDTGSMFLGLVLGAIACMVTMLEPSINMFFAVNLVLAIPIVDAFLAITRRLILRRPVFEADHMHIHHVLGAFGFTTRQTVVILYLMQTVMALLGVLAAMGFLFPLVVGIIFMVILFVTFIRMMVVIKPKAQAIQPKFAPDSIPSLEK